jgi:hypothetical protein
MRAPCGSSPSARTPRRARCHRAAAPIAPRRDDDVADPAGTVRHGSRFSDPAPESFPTYWSVQPRRLPTRSRPASSARRGQHRSQRTPMPDAPTSRHVVGPNEDRVRTPRSRRPSCRRRTPPSGLMTIETSNGLGPWSEKSSQSYNPTNPGSRRFCSTRPSRRVRIETATTARPRSSTVTSQPGPWAG